MGAHEVLRRYVHGEYGGVATTDPSLHGQRTSSLKACWLGIRVGKSLEKLVRDLNAIRARNEKRKKANPRVREEVAHLERYHPYVQRLARQFHAWGWVPMATEVPVLVRKWGIATRSDLVVWNKKLRGWFIVELKTGSAGVFDVETKEKFRAPFEHVPFSLKNSALAQACLALAMTREDPRYDKCSIMGVYVVWLCDRQFKRFGADAWCDEFIRHVPVIGERARNHQLSH
jgi:hypothetical protein